MPRTAIRDFDIFYLSYDEPQKEQFWARLQDLAPWAKRVDGVKGFDSAHKACANRSETEHFITVDGDNLVYPEFFDLELDIPETFTIKKREVPFKDVSLSWAGRNIVNGLCYGNGGLKLWSRQFVLDMRTHENADSKAETVDFCWDDKYLQLNNIYSDTYPNGSPFQAFRSGFREGVKMTLDRGLKVGEGKIERRLHEKNFKRLLIWASIGADVENGLWSVYGTRLGIYMANLDEAFDISKVSDYDWFKAYFASDILPLFECAGGERCPNTGVRWDPHALEDASFELLEPLQKRLGLQIADMDAQQSAFFKAVYEAPRRNVNPLLTEQEADAK